jgi:mono/diheme cytochrome c family protein
MSPRMRCALRAVLLASAVFALRSVEAQEIYAGKFPQQTGEDLFRNICQGCHMPDAKGAIGAGRYPALAADPALASKEFMVITLLQGRRNMPAFGGDGEVGLFFKLPTLNDEQIAAVINYVRSNFGNNFQGTVTAAEVKAQRHAQ